MRREKKIWGERWIVRRDSTHETSILFVKAGYRCSWHRHQAKHNKFVVIQGKLELVTCDGTTVLESGTTASVGPGIWHEFRAIIYTIAVEEMFVKYDPEDIEREIVGGKMVT